MIGRERRRLARMIHIALAAASGPTVMLACGGGGGGGGGDAADASTDAAVDATIASAQDAAVDSAHPAPPAADASTDSAVKGVDSGTRDAGSPDAFALGGCYIGGLDLGYGYGVDGAPDGQDTCEYSFGCGLPQGITNIGCVAYNVEEDGALVSFGAAGEACWLAAEAGCLDDAFAPGDGGAVTLLCNPCFGGGGRRPAGLARSEAARGASHVGAYLAAMAFEEGASIAAFTRMRAELVALRAPAALVGAAARATKDEARHARVMGRLARRRGGRVATVRVARAGNRTAKAIALENAVEGCVRETYGALVAAWQASRAEDPELRRAFTRIARDEADHAALSWALARWLEPRLDARDRARVERARARAVRALERDLREPDPSLAREAGLPTASRARALLAVLAREITTDARR